MSEEDDLLAAELAFGLIPAEERAALEARIAADPDFAAAVDRWRAYAAALAGDAGEPPRPSLWPAIEARLPANETMRDTGPMTGKRWRTLALAASLLAGIMTVVAIERRPAMPPPVSAAQPQPPLIAILRGSTEKGVVAVAFDPGLQRLTTAATAFDPIGHSAELWVIPADGRPRSLGVIDPSASRSAPSPAASGAAIAPGVTLAVSIEPIGGSPTGQPTGPVVLSGKVQKS